MYERNRKILINPDYQYLTDYIYNLPYYFENNGEIIQNGRNLVKYLEVNGLMINVKRFCVPPLVINRIIYRFFRSPKAVRAYTNALKLLSLGVNTPTPIGYIIHNKMTSISRCFFISLQCKFAQNIHYFERCELNDLTVKVLTELGHFIGRLHELGIYHKDFGGGNIMVNFNERTHEPEFSLIDINRMSFEKIDLERGCENFDRLSLSKPKIEIIARAYAQTRRYYVNEVIYNIIKYRKKHLEKRRLKKKLLN